ncbi:MAG: hypothetical protein ABMA15_18755, partial [Vicinamibacterales bacterium]
VPRGLAPPRHFPIRFRYRLTAPRTALRAMPGAHQERRAAEARRWRVRLFITMDGNLEHQQNLASLSFGVVVIDARRTGWWICRPSFLNYSRP